MGHKGGERKPREKRKVGTGEKDGWREMGVGGRKDGCRENESERWRDLCSTCDGWALAQVWRRDQIKSLSRQQWTRDKVITFPPSRPPLSSPPSTCLPPSVWVPAVCPHFTISSSQSGGRLGLHSWVMLDTLQSCTLEARFMTSLTFSWRIWWISLSVRNNILKVMHEMNIFHPSSNNKPEFCGYDVSLLVVESGSSSFSS